MATVAGGLLGATGGAALEQGLKTQKAMQYIVQLENGELKTIVQAIEPPLHTGEKVYVMISREGRSRVVSSEHRIKGVLLAGRINTKTIIRIN